VTVLPSGSHFTEGSHAGEEIRELDTQRFGDRDERCHRHVLSPHFDCLHVLRVEPRQLSNLLLSESALNA